MQRGTMPRGSSELTVQDARRIIVDGDVDLLVKRAQELARQSGATQTSVRRLFGEVRRIEMFWQEQDEDETRATQAKRRVALFRPRLAYQATRDPKLNDVKEALDPLLSLIEGRRERFQRFVEFFEALVAYMRK